MYTINLNDNPHKFEKMNLVTQIGNFDTLKCSKCGIKGKTTSLITLKVKGSYSKSKVDNCNSTDTDLRKGNTGKKVKIIFCTAVGESFENLKPNSEHFVIEVPKHENADSSGVWVMGTSEPVKILNNEFNYI